jgi:hypothetical protein
MVRFRGCAVFDDHVAVIERRETESAPGCDLNIQTIRPPFSPRRRRAGTIEFPDDTILEFRHRPEKMSDAKLTASDKHVPTWLIPQFIVDVWNTFTFCTSESAAQGGNADIRKIIGRATPVCRPSDSHDTFRQDNFEPSGWRLSSTKTWVHCVWDQTL